MSLNPENSNSEGIPAAVAMPEVKTINWKREIAEWVLAITFALIAAFLIKTFIFTLVTVDGPSMEPTLYTNDRLYVNRLMYTPQNGDIVVFMPHNFPRKPFVKRVIATPGQTIDIDSMNSIVYIDNEPIAEPYIAESIIRSGDMQYPLTVPDDNYFVMGDNRGNSHDSRDSDVGLVSKKEIMGKALFRFWPLSNMGSLYE